MSARIIFNLADRQLEDVLIRMIEAEPYLAGIPVSRTGDETIFEPEWLYVIDGDALQSPRMRQMLAWQEPHIVLIVPRGGCASYARQAWARRVGKIIERSESPDTLRFAIITALQSAA